MKNYAKLEEKFAKISALHDASEVLGWDSQVLMPESAAPFRAQQLAVIEECALSIIKDQKNLELIALAKTESLSDIQHANLREIEYIVESGLTIDNKLLIEFEEAKLNTEVIWREARQKSNFRLVAKELTHLFNLNLQIASTKAEKFGVSIYQAMINDFDRGLQEKSLDSIFTKIIKDIPAILTKSKKRDQSTSFNLHMHIEDQKKLANQIAKIFHFNFEHGRIDESLHPFSGGNSYDLRITTRYDTNDFLPALTGIIHEVGHALYEQNLPRDLFSQPVGQARGMAMHESQSLFMEKQIASSPQFISWLANFIKQTLPHHHIEESMLHSRLNHATPSLIRVDADELTYPLHIAIRYILEKKLVSGEVRIADLPDAWDELYQKHLGIKPDSHSTGCLQDIHWYSGAFGYFPSYTAGAIIASMIAKKLRRIYPNFNEMLGTANIKDIVLWLQKNIHNKASIFTLSQLLEQAVDSDLDYDCYLDYLQNKFA